VTAISSPPTTEALQAGVPATPAGVPPYVPHPRWTGGHWMTIYTWARRRRFPALPAPEARVFEVAPDARVLAHVHWQPARREAPTLLALHGLEGSSSAHYMVGLADKAFARGFNVVRLNQRNCGGTEILSAGLYHSGLTADPIAVLRELAATEGLTRFGVVGYSLGGNLTLKLAGEAGADPALVPGLRAVCAVSPTMDLALCVDALERRANAVYQWNFMRNLKARMRRKAAAWPGRFDTAPLARLRTVRGFDDVYTAPHHGFAGAADYYHRASALRVVDRIRVPALVVASDNDPFVPHEQFTRPEVTGNPNVRVVITRDGGHCGFLSEGAPGFDGYWAERAAVEFLATYT
jgi:predicted alpha/beta-fold hydrolase